MQFVHKYNQESFRSIDGQLLHSLSLDLSSMRLVGVVLFVSMCLGFGGIVVSIYFSLFFDFFSVRFVEKKVEFEKSDS